MKLRKLSDLKKEEIDGKRVVVRLDLDVPEDDYTRIETSKETLQYLLDNGAALRLIGHKGRPKGEIIEKYSLKNLISPLKSIIGKEILFSVTFNDYDDNSKIILFENLRFNTGEENNDEGFAKKLSRLGDLYVNESFAVSHRAHASFVGIPKFIPGYAGFRLVSEVEHLDKVRDNPERPLVVLISGIKDDKLEMIRKVKNLADKVLVGGRLPEFIEMRKGYEDILNDEKIVVARLNPDKEDITLHTIEKFSEEIKKAGTIVLAGVMGKYEDPGHLLGTQKVFKVIADSGAYKVAGGGDTEAALTDLNMTDKFEWISVGGGAMLTYLVEGTLPGLEMLVKV